VRRYWGHDRLRPLQDEAIQAGLDHRDSLVVLPTGGGKSLCYQVPPLLADRTDVVVSPLISLMKDQVDGLRACGYPAAALHSGMTPDARREAERRIASGEARLVFVAPERLLTPGFLQTVERLKVRAFAIDEAHCISHWGHDFRPEYRQLATLKDRFPQASLHAYTATATERVRRDIVEQLRLRDPSILIGVFDRPNLIYRVVPRMDAQSQVLEVVRRHHREAVIVYCISRKDTETTAAHLAAHGVKAEAYHAGLEPEERRRIQDAFADESLDVVVATVAFGMGIDRSNVRCVLHAAMPKSVEHYQQETGRAGRDGLASECVLLYSAADAMRWESLIERSAKEAESPPDLIEAAVGLLRRMRTFCSGAVCRHRALSQYFGQEYPARNCGACDTCLDEVEGLEDATVTAQKILSCVARVQERFGVGHVVDVLLGADTEPIRRLGHVRLSTFGLLKDTPRKALQAMVYQLVDLGVLRRTDGDWPVLTLNEESWKVLRGEREVRLVQPKAGPVKKTRADAESWAGVDQGLFEHLRDVRREIAETLSVPPYIVFGDETLRALAALRPGSVELLLNVWGIGDLKQAAFGQRIVKEIRSYCSANGLALDVTGEPVQPSRKNPKPSANCQAAFAMFARGCSLDEVMSALGRARSTTTGYLADYIQAERPDRIDPWVDAATYAKVATVAKEAGTPLLKPLFDRLDGQVPYDTIRLVARHLEALADRRGAP